jgi:hypothetical protein
MRASDTAAAALQQNVLPLFSAAFFFNSPTRTESGGPGERPGLLARWAWPDWGPFVFFRKRREGSFYLYFFFLLKSEEEVRELFTVSKKEKR